MRSILSIIGLSQDLIYSFRDQNGRPYQIDKILEKQIIEGEVFTLLKTPNLIKFAKEILNCSDLLGLPLEERHKNQQLWNQNFFSNDINSELNLNQIETFTIFDLAVLNDSGWYDINIELEESRILNNNQKYSCSTIESIKLQIKNALLQQQCQQMCSSNGICISNKCYCFKTYFGQTCESVRSDKLTSVKDQQIRFLQNQTIDCIGYLDQNGSCLPCYQKCDKCTGSLEKDCTQCIAPLLLSSLGCVEQCQTFEFKTKDNKCVSCAQNCLSCESLNVCINCIPQTVNQNGLCQKLCNKGFYSDQKICKKCADNCSKCIGPQEDQCSECLNDYKFYLNRCYSNCPPETYLDTIQNKFCYPCDVSCQGCVNSGNNNCKICQKGYILVNQKCLIECQSNQFREGDGCTNCQQNCSKCINLKNCTSCISPSVNQDGICQSKCNEGNYFNQSLQICQKCQDENCQVCSNQSTCIKCNSNFYLYQNQCYSTCPTKTFKQISTQSCIDCANLCQECNGISNNTCLKCIPNYFLSKSTCVSDCGSNQYKDNTNFICVDCPQYCSQCNQTQCTQCQLGYFLKEHTCQAGCGEGFYKDGTTCRSCLDNCKTCSNNSTCSECKDGFKQYKNSCIGTCDGNRYLNGNICQDCNIACNGCKGGNAASNCIQCSDLYEKYPNQNLCVLKCQEKQYYDLSKSSCQSCSQNCDQCESTSKCIKCSAGYYNQQGVCQNKCNPGWQSDSNLVCFQCFQGCNTCEGKDKNQCLSCSTSYFLYQKSCYNPCPEGTYSQLDACQKCDISCKTCKAAGNDQCIQCNQQYFKDGNLCVVTCRNEYFGDTADSTCKQCQQYCSKCNSLAICQICYQEFVNQDGKCQKNCNTTYYKNSDSQCQKCGSYCKICNSPTTCLTCVDNSYLYNGVCYDQKCPDGTYKLPNINECVECDKACRTCTGETNQNCIDCNPNYEMISPKVCSKICDSGYFRDVDKVCKLCNQQNCEYCDSKTCFRCKLNFYFQEGQCLTSCKYNYYNENGSFICKKCESSCATCYGSNNNQCLSCFSGKVLYQGYCLSECPDGFYNNNQICQPCNETCLSCKQTANKCITCKVGYELETLTQTCILPCGENKYKDQNKLCKDCFKNCKVCINGNTCLQCQDDFKLQDNRECRDSCLEKFYPDKSNICQLCGPHCIQCDSSSLCNICEETFQLIKGTCLKQCKVGQYVDKDVCKSCSENCINCTSEVNCTQCLTNYKVEKGKCQLKDILDSVENKEQADKFKQMQCHFTCSLCTGSSFNQCLSCSANRMLNSYIYNEDLGLYIGECNCPVNMIDTFQPNCLDSIQETIQKYVQASTTIISATTSTLASLMTVQKVFFFQTVDFAQTVASLSYINKKNSIKFDDSLNYLRMMNINFIFPQLFKSNTSEKPSKNIRMLTRTTDELSTNKIENIHNSNNFLVSSFSIGIINFIFIIICLALQCYTIPFLKKWYHYLIGYSKLALPTTILFITTSELSLCALLQLDQFKNDRSSYRIAGLLLAILFILYILILTFYQYFISLKSNVEDIKNRIELYYYFSMLNTHSNLSKSFFAILTTKKFIQSFLIVISYEKPLILTPILFIIEAIFLVLIIVNRPYFANFLNYLSIISTASIIIIYIVYMILLFHSDEESQIQYQGMIVIYSIINLVLVIQSIFSLVILLTKAIELFKQLKNKKTETIIMQHRLQSAEPIYQDNYETQIQVLHNENLSFSNDSWYSISYQKKLALQPPQKYILNDFQKKYLSQVKKNQYNQNLIENEQM